MDVMENFIMKKQIIFTASILLLFAACSKSEKEKIYINMLSSIVKHIDKNIDIFFDHTDFDDNIILKIKNVFSNVGLIEPKDSFVEKGIQIIDNLCSVVGRHETNCDIRNFYTLIEKHVKKVDINESKWYSNSRN